MVVGQMNKAEALMASFPDLDYRFNPRMPKKLKGLCHGDIIWLNPNQHETELPGNLAEEIGHHLTGVGKIIDQKTNAERKQEQKARDVGVKLVVTPADILSCYKEGLIYRWECAEFLGITLKTLNQAIEAYAKTNDGKLKYSHYTIYFKPNGTVEIFDWFN